MEELLAKYFSENTSNEEREEVLKWRNENPGDFLLFKQAWIGAKEVSPPEHRLKDIFDEDRKTIQLNEKKIFSNWYKYAASLALLITATYLIYFFGIRDTGAGIYKTVEFEDGSRVVLYKEAEIIKVNFTKDDRSVEISGKAYFDIERDETRPFSVYTKEAKIEVLGTSFLVDANSPYTTEVIVETGIVAFSQNPVNYPGRVTNVKLIQGEKGVIKPEAKGIIKQMNRDDNYLAWANQELIFKKTKLSDVSKLIDEVYGYKVKFSNNDLANCRLTATYKKKSPKELVKLISETFGFTYKVSKDNKVTLSGEGCQ